MEQFWGIFSGVVGVVGYGPYLRDIVRGKAQPDRASWLIWAVQYTVLFFAQWAKGGDGTLWLIGLQWLGIVLVSALSIRFGAGRFTRNTYILLGIVGLGLVLWYFTSDATTALCISLAIEVSGVVLTARKAYRQPDSETPTIWALIALSGLLGILAVDPQADPILYLFPISLAIINGSIVAATWLGTRRTRQLAQPTELAE
jgi:hypothetical protein